MISGYFSSLNYTDYLQEHPIHELVGIDLDEYGDPEEKKNPVFWESVRNVSAESIPPELDDLIRLHFMVISRKVTTVMEFGVGKSTIVLADAIKYNESIHEAYVAKIKKIKPV